MVCFFSNFPCLPCPPGTSEFNLKLLCDHLLALRATVSEFISLQTWFSFFLFFSFYFYYYTLSWIISKHFGEKARYKYIQKEKRHLPCLQHRGWDSHTSVFKRTQTLGSLVQEELSLGCIWPLQRCELYQPWRRGEYCWPLFSWNFWK